MKGGKDVRERNIVNKEKEGLEDRGVYSSGIPPPGGGGKESKDVEV